MATTSKRLIKTVMGPVGSGCIVSVYRLPESEEYLVRVNNSPASHGYYTDDKDDALATAAAMASKAGR